MTRILWVLASFEEVAMKYSSKLIGVFFSLAALTAASLMLGSSQLQEVSPNSKSAMGSGTSVLIGGDEVQAQANGSSRTLHLNPAGGDVKMGAYGMHGPVAYGRVNASGTPLSFSSNISATHRHGLGQYDLHVAGGGQVGDVIVVTAYGHTAVPSVVLQVGVYHITMFDLSSGNPVDAAFSFVIYRP